MPTSETRSMGITETSGQSRPARATAAAPLSIAACSTAPTDPNLDSRSLITTHANRWSAEGEPTIYLASDPGVGLAELGRHWDEQPDECSVWSVRLTLDAAADLRDPGIRAALGLPEDRTWVLDADRCSALASRLRSEGMHDGMVVPSVAFLDDPSRWNAVVFVDRLTRSLGEAVRVGTTVLRVGTTESQASSTD
ncbi:MAG: RES family NAD+ phosphorylase [Chloroflexota bacterium]